MTALHQLLTALFGFVLLAAGPAGSQTSALPQSAVDDLLEADRAFATAAGKDMAVVALSRMFAEDVWMMSPPGVFAQGKAKATEALTANPDNTTARVEWTPIRGGIAADGQHGFTFGYMTLHRSDKTRTPLKYLSYWVKQKDGWRVAVYKRSRAAEGTASHALMPPAVPARLVAPSTDDAQIAKFRESLDQAERAFSDEAQKIGLGPAFAKHGSADAINLGPPTEAGVIVGAEAIGRSIGAGAPGPTSPVNWSPDRVIVASSGDLGVTLGMIRQNKPDKPGQPGIAFITVWRRATTADPWRYVAE
jgi:ketosteroid isomerase-like protein